MIAVCLLLLCSAAQARVTFTHSEVLQQSDLGTNNRAAFKCDNDCDVYTDSRSAELYIMEYDERTGLNDIVTSFNNIGGVVPQHPVPFSLNASANYFIENLGDSTHNFVFYVVDHTSPNLDTAVLVITDDDGVDLKFDEDRLLTTLSSKYDAVRYTALLVASASTGYPRIYATGFDATVEAECQPMYQSRNLLEVDDTAITVFSPISTIDYGRDGQHEVTVRWDKDGQITKASHSAVAYTSPGYVGCTYNRDQQYTTSKTSLLDQFTLKSHSLDVSGTFNLPNPEDALHIKINNDQFDFIGSPPFSEHYNADKYTVNVTWTRSSPGAFFAVQFDFGLGKTDDYDDDTTVAKVATTTKAAAQTTKPTTTPMPTTQPSTTVTSPPTSPTTSGAAAAMGFLSVIVLALL